ncbi:MAG: helix-turn-helix transcriptional regulator [Actinomycetota bacterium]|nr:helix-turn-helix transcriptional regulator [Actinomycetota bacterium]
MSSKELYEEVGRRIRKAREKRNLTQERLAELISLTRTSITNIERGNQKLLLHTLYDIASTLGVDPHSLLPKEPDSSYSMQLRDSLPSDLSEAEREWIQSVVTKPKEKG